jgi:ABC-2 type transport system permease protein
MSASAFAVTPRAADGRAQWNGTNVLMQTVILTGRSLSAIASSRGLVLVGLLQPLVILVLFSQVFASLANTAEFPHGVSYIDYLMPAVLVMGTLSAALQTGIGLVEDMRNGVIARFRTLPVSAGAVLVARSLADVVRQALQLALMLVLAATVFGFSPSGGFLGVIAAWLMCIAVGWALSWVFMAVGTWVRNAELMQAVTSMAMFPLMFASTAYVPARALPAWLRAVAMVNPLTYSVDASRNLALGLPVGTGVVAALGVSAGLGLAGAVIATRGFRRSG